MNTTDDGREHQDQPEGQVSELAVAGEEPQPISPEDPAADEPKDGTGGVHESDGDSHPR